MHSNVILFASLLMPSLVPVYRGHFFARWADRWIHETHFVERYASIPSIPGNNWGQSSGVHPLGERRNSEQELDSARSTLTASSTLAARPPYCHPGESRDPSCRQRGAEKEEL